MLTIAPAGTVSTCTHPRVTAVDFGVAATVAAVGLGVATGATAGVVGTTFGAWAATAIWLTTLGRGTAAALCLRQSV
jgi:hypothetical protein